MKAGDKILEGKELGNSLKTEIGIDLVSGILPKPIEMAIEKSGLGEMSKDMAKTSIRAVVEVAKYNAKEQLIQKNEDNH